MTLHCEASIQSLPPPQCPLPAATISVCISNCFCFKRCISSIIIWPLIFSSIQMLQLSDLSTQHWQTLCHNVDFSQREYKIACPRKLKHAHRQLGTVCQQNDMPCFELRWVYLSPVVTHYQEGEQLYKVTHIIEPMKEKYTESRQELWNYGSSFSIRSKKKSLFFCHANHGTVHTIFGLNII